MLQGLLRHGHYILLALSLCLLAALVAAIDVRVFIGYLETLAPSTIGLWLAVYGATWLLRALRLAVITGKRIGLVAAFRLQVAAFALNLLYPAKIGDLLVASSLESYIGRGYQGAVAFMLHLRLLDLVTLACLVLASLSIAPPDEVLSEISLLFWVLLAGGVVFVAGTLWLQNTEWLRALQDHLPQKMQRVKPLFLELLSLQRFDRVYILSIAISLAIRPLEAVTVYLISRESTPAAGSSPCSSRCRSETSSRSSPSFPADWRRMKPGSS